MTPIELFNKKLQEIANGEAQLASNVLKHQLKIYNLILEEYYPLFELDKGIILANANNDALINQIDVLFDKLNGALNKDLLSPLVRNILSTAKLSAEYYESIGFKKTIIDNILKDKIALERKLGFTPKGQLSKKGYLYKLGQTAQVRQQLKSYVVDSLTGDTPFLQFQQGLKNLILGNSSGVNGAMVKYFDVYAIDSFAQVDSLVNAQFANELQLKHFIYEGSVIKTTRDFCRKKAGKAFSVEEAKKNWPNDPDLPDKKTKARYTPLIDRGRYRCRHAIRYITKALYKEFKKSGRT